MASKAFRHTFTVVGRGVFPVDMLRYDACYPADSNYRIDTRPSPAEYRETVKTTLAHIGPKNWTPTSARWSSFGWSVDPTTIQKQECNW